MSNTAAGDPEDSKTEKLKAQRLNEQGGPLRVTEAHFCHQLRKKLVPRRGHNLARGTPNRDL